MPQVESLTVQILGDSSGLQQELNSVADLLDGLQQQLSAASEGAGEFGNALGGLSSALAPLQSLSGQLSVVIQQVQQLSGQSITLNVQPALDALGSLVQAVQAAAAQLAALNSNSVSGPIAGASYIEETAAVGGQGFASGGIVSGPSGIDQVPAWLTAGEFVLNRDAVATLGVNELERWNRGGSGTAVAIPNVTERTLSVPQAIPARPRSASLLRSATDSTAPAQQTMNHFGGIEIHVRETTDVNELMGDLRRQGIGLRQRWG